MARVCVFCDKKPVVGNKISHSNIKTKTRHTPNLQKVRAFVDGVAQRVYACTRCLRSGRLTKPPVNLRPKPMPGAEVAAATA